MSLPHPLRRVPARLGQVAVTFALFSFGNAIAFHFEVQNGVSILFPATAVAIVACMYFGIWGAIGVVLGTMATPWGANADAMGLFVSGVISAIEGFIPHLVFRARRDLAPDLRDMKSLLAFLLFGTLLNTLFSAVAGNLFIVQHAASGIVWREVFAWWLADFVAALLLATPALAFGGVFLGRLRHDASEKPRTIVNTLQIITVIVLLGFVASFMIRTYLLNVDDFAAKRQTILLVAALVDGFVLLILVLASATLLVNVSRPFAQIRAAIAAIREGERLDAPRIDSRYAEFRSIAETLEETSRELRRREEALRLQTDRAVAASKHKSDFLAKMSHELRTPLNSIIGFSDLLMEQEETIDSAKRMAFLGNVSTSAKHLLGLINDLLDIAKVEAGKMNLHFEEIDLRRAINNTVATTAPLFGRKRQEVEIAVPDEPMLVRADISRVEQVLLNLLSNANKFSPEGDKIVIRSTPEPTRWRIEVADHGIGISRDDQRRIFDEFEQVQMRGRGHGGGTGLGLALARHLVEAHGGSIDVESTLGRGSTFRVSLPRAHST
jgi:signal transduction histidine kinase